MDIIVGDANADEDGSTSLDLEEEATLEAEPESEPEAKVEGKPDTKTPSDTKLPADTFPKTQEDLDRVVSERVTREQAKWQEKERDFTSRLSQMQELVNRIAEGRVPKGPEQPTIPKTHMDIADVGKYLNDPDYVGWTMAALKKEHPDHFEHVKTRIMNKMDVDQRFQKLEEQRSGQREDQETLAKLQPKLAKVKELLGEKANDYFWPDGRFNDRFMQEYVQWGVQNGIHDPLLAFQLRDAKGTLRDKHFSAEELEDFRKKAIADGAKGLVDATKEKGGPRTTSKKETSAAAVSSDSDTKELQSIFVDKKKGWKEARQILIDRGEL
jgi:hypothetical protein